MGSPLGPLMANAFMCSLEEKLSKFDKLPSFYNRYVDDTLTKQSSLESAESFLSILNNTGLLLRYHSHVDKKYKRSLITTMLNRAYRLSSSWQHFSNECERLTRLKYPPRLVDSAISTLIGSMKQLSKSQIPANRK